MNIHVASVFRRKMEKLDRSVGVWDNEIVEDLAISRPQANRYGHVASHWFRTKRPAITARRSVSAIAESWANRDLPIDEKKACRAALFYASAGRLQLSSCIVEKLSTGHLVSGD